MSLSTDHRSVGDPTRIGVQVRCNAGARVGTEAGLEEARPVAHGSKPLGIVSLAPCVSKAKPVMDL